jgi:hypothetical protein
MTSPESLFSRWVRLKRSSDIRRGTEVADDRPAEIPLAEIASADDTSFDPASLPSIEAIDVNTDIRGFLQSGVPAELTRAVLRQAWTRDPAIRDFIGIAENQWDFNDPDAIFGFGPLQATDNAPAVFTQVASKLENIPEAFSETPTSVVRAPSGVADPEPSAPDQGAELIPDQPRSTANGLPEAGAETERAPAVDIDGASRKTRRHGSALPR